MIKRGCNNCRWNKLDRVPICIEPEYIQKGKSNCGSMLGYPKFIPNDPDLILEEIR